MSILFKGFTNFSFYPFHLPKVSSLSVLALVFVGFSSHVIILEYGIVEYEVVDLAFQFSYI